jgi:homoserine dehydrogenase
LNPSPVVLKFGSSVLPHRDSLPAVVHEIYRYYRRGHRVLAVVSAIGRFTDLLLEEAKHWSSPPAPDLAVAELLATGERQSAALLTMALARAGIDSTLLSPADIELTLSGDRLDAAPTSVNAGAIREAFRSSPVLVLPGFAGVHESGGTALLGRGGTDLTAVFLASALAVQQCRLVKDVDGIYERDPATAVTQVSADQRPHRYGGVTYDEALRVSGNLVQPKAIEYLRDQKTTARVAGLLLEDGTDIGALSSSVHDRPPTTPLKLLLLGLGQVGQGVYCHLQQLSAFFEIAGIHVRDPHKTRDFEVRQTLLSSDLGQLLTRPHDLVVDVCGDPSTAYRVIQTCLRAGRPAVSASKRLVAEHGAELSRLATKSATRFCYSAVCGGAPMIETLTQALQHGPVTRLRGVLNGTCNYILDRLAEGVPMHTAVSQARLQGFAEANVSRDLYGDDSVDKLRILARLAFGAESDAIPISRQGMPLTGNPPLGMDGAEGRVVRQVATFDPANGASVQLVALPADDYLAGARGEENRLLITGADGREWRVRGKGAGRWPTAEAVIADLLDIHTQLVSIAVAAALPSRHATAAPHVQRPIAAATVAPT